MAEALSTHVFSLHRLSRCNATMMDSDHAYRPVLLQVIPDEEGCWLRKACMQLWLMMDLLFHEFVAAIHWCL